MLLISSYNYGLVRKMWYYYQYVITIIYILFSLCCFGLFNCVPSFPRVTMILCWKWRIIMCDSVLSWTRSKQMSLTCRMYLCITCVNKLSTYLCWELDSENNHEREYESRILVHLLVSSVNALWIFRFRINAGNDFVRVYCFIDAALT